MLTVKINYPILERNISNTIEKVFICLYANVFSIYLIKLLTNTMVMQISASVAGVITATSVKTLDMVGPKYKIISSFLILRAINTTSK